MQRVDYIRGPWVLRACGRNPLVRASDRLELLIIALGILVALVAAACAGALGTAVHDARSREYVAQAHTRHAVTARATEDSTLVPRIHDGMATLVNAQWQVNGNEHTAILNWDRAVKTGDPLTIWVDGDGDRVDAPAPTAQAGADAVCVAYSAWLAVVFATAGAIYWGRSRLDRRRDSAWERELRCLIHDSASGDHNS